MRVHLIRKVQAIAVLAVTILGFQNCAPSAQFEHVDPPATVVDQASTSTGAVVNNASIHGLVTNALNSAPISGVQVQVRSALTPSTVVASMTTDSSGNYQTPALAVGTYLVDFSASGFIALSGVSVTLSANEQAVLNESLSTLLSNGQIRIVLNWCDAKTGAVEDVDSYLSVPGDSLPVYYHNKTGTGAQLDIDVIHWQGPETITINTLEAGTYIYYVNNYSYRASATALGNSNVRVSVYKGSALLKNYTIPAGSGITYEVFHIVNGQLVDVNQYNNSLPVASQ